MLCWYRGLLQRIQVVDLGGWGVVIPWGNTTPDDGECHMMGLSTMDLGGREGHWAVLHEAVDEEADVDSAVVSVGLLGYSLLCAAYKGPGAVIGPLESSDVFVLDELEALCGVFAAVFFGQVVGDMGVKVCDRGCCEVDGQAGPVVTVPVKWEEQFTVMKGCSIGELVPPACEPAAKELE